MQNNSFAKAQRSYDNQLPISDDPCDDCSPCAVCNGLPYLNGEGEAKDIYIKCNCGRTTELCYTADKAINLWNDWQASDANPNANVIPAYPKGRW